MTNDEWENFKKYVKPIKTSGIIKSSSKNNAIKINQTKKFKVSKNFNHIDLEDNPQRTFQIDKNIIKRIKKGKIDISTILDLHGCTVNESKEKVAKFIEKNFFLRNRLVLIITGKGKSISVSDGWKADGKLKKNVPIWLCSTYLSKFVLWFDTATPEKGGSGALFVYLKKTKE